MKRAFLAALCLILALSGCRAGPPEGADMPDVPDVPVVPDGQDSPAGAVGGAENGQFQKEMSVNHPFRLGAACRGVDGYYLENEGFVYYMERDSGRMIILCGRPDCRHEPGAGNCDAWANTHFLTFWDGKLWYTNSDAFHDGLTLCTMDPDGSDHRDVQLLKEHESSFALSEPMISGGRVYFVAHDTDVCANVIGGDMADNVLLLRTGEDDKLPYSQWSWRFWADGDRVYVMLHYTDTEGHPVDVLYLLGGSQEDTREVWRSSEIVGDAAEASWYIDGGVMRYFVSGQLWRVEPGGAEKIAEADGVRAVFTDELTFVCGSERVTVLGPDGGVRAEIDLGPVYGAYGDVSNCDPVFADGEVMYLLAYRGWDKNVSSALFKLDAATGEVTEIKDWPAAGTEPDTGGGSFTVNTEKI